MAVLLLDYTCYENTMALKSYLLRVKLIVSGIIFSVFISAALGANHPFSHLHACTIYFSGLQSYYQRHTLYFNMPDI